MLFFSSRRRRTSCALVTGVQKCALPILSGFAAQRGLLDLYWVMAVGFCGTFAGDQLYYFIGRHWRTTILAKRPTRSDEGRGGKECVSTCRSRWSPLHSKNKK